MMPYADNKGIRIYYEVEGQGPPLVLVHGHGMGMDLWRSLGYVVALRDDHQLVLVDTRGHGKSDKPTAPEAYYLAPLCDDMLAVLDHAGVQTAHFMGHSAGAAIVCSMTAHAPHRLASAVLASFSPFVRSNERRMQAQMRTITSAGLDRLLASLEASESLSPALRAHVLASDHAALVGWTVGGSQWADMGPLLPAIKVPCLVYAGDRDPHHDGAREAAGLVKGAGFVSLPGIGHLGAFLRSDLALPHVRLFLSKLGSDRAVTARQ